MQKNDEVEYEIIDFNGYIPWTRREDGKYAVDPLYFKKFKEAMKIK